MRSVRLILALLIALAVPVTATAGLARADACSGHSVPANQEHADHHGGMASMHHDQTAGTDCDTGCECPALHCSAGHALNGPSTVANVKPHPSRLPFIAASPILPGYSDTPYRPPTRD